MPNPRSAAERNGQLLLRQVERSGQLPPETDPATALEAVLGLLAQRLSGGEARDFVHALPPLLRTRLGPVVSSRDEVPERFGRDEFLSRVARRLGIATGRAEDLSVAIFRALRTHLPAEHTRHVEGQLPGELQSLWRG